MDIKINILLLSFIALSLAIIFLKLRQKRNLPPGPFALPIIGHIHLLKNPVHRALQSLADRYGPVLFLRFGSLPVLVVSSPSAVKQCFTQNDVTFANRPNIIAAEQTGYNSSTVVFSPYGDRWRDLRRVTAIHIFSAMRIETLFEIRRVETNSLLRRLHRPISGDDVISGAAKVNLSTNFSKLAFDVAMRLVDGEGTVDRGEVQKMFHTAMFMNECDYLPFLRWIGFRGIEKRFMRIKNARDAFMQGMIDKCRRERDDDSCSKKKSESLVDILLAHQDADPEFYTDITMKGIITTIFAAGTDTIARTMEWTMSLLLNHPTILQKAKEEIDKHVQPDHLLDDSDLPKLTYLHCIINETLRLFPVLPLLLPHSSSQNCTVNGYNIPRGTMLLVNAWALHRNPDVWKEPTKFKPERFLDRGLEDDEYEKYKFVPFGLGRRACPGGSLGIRLVGLALGKLIQCFDWERVGTEMVDLGESSGTTMKKTIPLEVMCYPRSSMTELLSQV